MKRSKIYFQTVFVVNTLEGLCVEAIFSSLFRLQFRAHKPGRKIAKATSGLSPFSHLAIWQEVQLREFVSTPCETVWLRKLGPADERHVSLAPPSSPTARLLWSTARFAPSYTMSQHCLRGKGAYDDCSGLCVTASFPRLHVYHNFVVVL